MLVQEPAERARAGSVGREPEQVPEQALALVGPGEPVARQAEVPQAASEALAAAWAVWLPQAAWSPELLRSAKTTTKAVRAVTLRVTSPVVIA